MANGRNTLMDPPIEEPARQGRLEVHPGRPGLHAGPARSTPTTTAWARVSGRVVPPQVTSVSGKPLSIAFEEIAAGKATYTRPDPEARPSGG